MSLVDIFGAIVLISLLVFAWWWVERRYPEQKTWKKQLLQSLFHMFGQWKAQLLFWFGWSLIFGVGLSFPVEHGLVLWQYFLLATFKAALFFAGIHLVIDVILARIPVKTVGTLRRLRKIRYAFNILAGVLIYFIIE